METVEKLVKKTDIFKINPSLIVIEEGFNVREDMGDIDALMESIVTNGLEVPIKVQKRKGVDEFVLVDGHRRMTAINKALSLGHEIKYVEATMFSGNNEDRIFSMVITGTAQKTLTPLEQAEAFARLVNFGYKVDEIAKRIGKSVPHVYNQLLLAKIPKKVKEYITNNQIKPTTVINLLKEKYEDEELTTLVENAINNIEDVSSNDGNLEVKPKTKRVTGKAIGISKNIETKLKEVIEHFDSIEVSNEKIELIAQILQLPKNATNEEIIEILK